MNVHPAQRWRLMNGTMGQKTPHVWPNRWPLVLNLDAPQSWRRKEWWVPPLHPGCAGVVDCLRPEFQARCQLPPHCNHCLTSLPCAQTLIYLINFTSFQKVPNHKKIPFICPNFTGSLVHWFLFICSINFTILLLVECPNFTPPNRVHSGCCCPHPRPLPGVGPGDHPPGKDGPAGSGVCPFSKGPNAPMQNADHLPIFFVHM